MIVANVLITLIFLLNVNLIFCQTFEVDYCFDAGYCAIRSYFPDDNAKICKVMCGSESGSVPNEHCSEIITPTMLSIPSNCSSSEYIPDTNQDSMEIQVNLCWYGQCNETPISWTVSNLGNRPTIKSLIIEFYDSIEGNVIFQGKDLTGFQQPYFELYFHEPQCNVIVDCTATEPNSMNCLLPKVIDICTLQLDYDTYEVDGHFHAHGAARPFYDQKYRLHQFPEFYSLTWDIASKKFFIGYRGYILPLFPMKIICSTENLHKKLENNVEFEEEKLWFQLDHENLAQKTLNCSGKINSHVFLLGTVLVDLSVDGIFTTSISAIPSSVSTEDTPSFSTVEVKTKIESSNFFLSQSDLYLILSTIGVLVALSTLIVGLTLLKVIKKQKKIKSHYPELSNSHLSSALTSTNETMSKYYRR